MKRETDAETPDYHPIVRAFIPIITGICRDLDALEIKQAMEGEHLIINVSPGMDDYRMLVGARGRCVHSMQRLVTRAGETHRILAELNLITPTQGRGVAVHHFTPNPNFDVPKLMVMINDLCDQLGMPAPVESRNENGKCRVVFAVTRLEDRATVEDMDNVIYGYGQTNGRRVEIKTET